MAAEVQPALQDEDKYEHRSQRTKAVPKHSLFGSVMERLDPEDVDTVRKIDIKEMERREMRERQERRDRYKPKLPDSLKGQIPGDEVLDYKKDEFVRQVRQTSRARNLIDTLEERSKYFAVGALENKSAPHPAGRRHQWMTEKDLQNAGDINSVGLNGKSYNRDKYQERAPVHQYSVIGDPLKLGMDFPTKNTPSAPKLTPPKRYKAPDWLPKEYYMHPKDMEEKPTSAISLPPNIQHQFGTKICNSVLSDKGKIEETLDLQRRIRDSAMRKKSLRKKTRVGSVCETDPSYEQLGGALRQNVFPGYTYNHKRSLARSVYTDDVHAKRYHDPEEYRYQRDALSSWNEHNILYLRRKRMWDEHAADAPKFAANWDRNATRPPPPPQQSQPKPKPKSKNKPAKKETAPAKPAFEDVVFETPPTTPLPPLPNPVPLAEGAKRDDEFWNLYNEKS